MTNLTTFTYLSKLVRVVEIDGQPWFIAKDVCEQLGYYDGRKALYEHTDPTQRQHLAKSNVSAGNISGFPNRGMTAISEGGLFALVLGSSLPTAKEFKLWVTEVVLPAIRKDGMYVAGEEKAAAGEISDEELTLLVMERLQKKIARLKAEKEEAETKLIEAQPLITLGGQVEQHLRSLTRVARSFTGVNSMKIKADLLDAGYLYKSSEGTYRVYAKYRQTHFVERFEPQYGKVDIFVAPKGYETVAQLHAAGRLTMLKAYA